MHLKYKTGKQNQSLLSSQQNLHANEPSDSILTTTSTKFTLD